MPTQYNKNNEPEMVSIDKCPFDGHSTCKQQATILNNVKVVCKCPCHEMWTSMGLDTIRPKQLDITAEERLALLFALEDITDVYEEERDTTMASSNHYLVPHLRNVIKKLQRSYLCPYCNRVNYINPAYQPSDFRCTGCTNWLEDKEFETLLREEEEIERHTSQ